MTFQTKNFSDPSTKGLFSITKDWAGLLEVEVARRSVLQPNFSAEREDDKGVHTYRGFSWWDRTGES